MAEACFNINNVAFHFDIHKAIAYRITSRCVQTKLAGDRPRSVSQKKKTNSIGEMFYSDHFKKGDIFTANPLCIASRNCFLYVRVPRNRSESSPMHVENFQNIDILFF